MRKLLLASVFALVAGAASAQSANQAYIEQTGGQYTGGGNTATQDQGINGNRNVAYIYQTGTTGSTALQVQTGGGDNTATATQNLGTGNLIEQKQIGSQGGQMTATQQGGSTNTIRQNQTGTMHESIAYQGGGSNSVTTHTQTGNSGSGHYANSAMYNMSNSTQTVTQNNDGARNIANQTMGSAGGAAGSYNVQSILQTSGGNTATQYLR